MTPERQPDEPKPTTLADILALIPKANWWENLAPSGATTDMRLIFLRKL